MHEPQKATAVKRTGYLAEAPVRTRHLLIYFSEHQRSCLSKLNSDTWARCTLSQSHGHSSHRIADFVNLHEISFVFRQLFFWHVIEGALWMGDQPSEGALHFLALLYPVPLLIISLVLADNPLCARC